MKTCSVDGCELKSDAKGFCPKHYGRWKRNGNPAVKTKATKGDLDKWLDEHVNYSGNECLIWPFGKSRGYGVAIALPGRSAHREMLYRATGVLPADKQAAHLCGNGRGACVNPKHLAWKTPRENQADQIVHGTARRGEKSNRAVISAKTALEVKRRLVAGQKQHQIRRDLDLTEDTVGHIARGHSWAWL